MGIRGRIRIKVINSSIHRGRIRRGMIITMAMGITKISMGIKTITIIRITIIMTIKIRTTTTAQITTRNSLL